MPLQHPRPGEPPAGWLVGRRRSAVNRSYLILSLALHAAGLATAIGLAVAGSWPEVRHPARITGRPSEARVGVDPATRIDRIDTTYYATVALLSDGSMWSWGTKASTSGTYFLGDATSGSRLLPGRLTLPVGLDTALAGHSVTGLDCSYTHCLITTSNGSFPSMHSSLNRRSLTSSVRPRETVAKSRCVTAQDAARSR